MSRMSAFACLTLIAITVTAAAGCDNRESPHLTFSKNRWDGGEITIATRGQSSDVYSVDFDSTRVASLSLTATLFQKGTPTEIGQRECEIAAEKTAGTLFMVMTRDADGVTNDNAARLSSLLIRTSNRSYTVALDLLNLPPADARLRIGSSNRQVKLGAAGESCAIWMIAWGLPDKTKKGIDELQGAFSSVDDETARAVSNQPDIWGVVIVSAFWKR